VGVGAFVDPRRCRVTAEPSALRRALTGDRRDAGQPPEGTDGRRDVERALVSTFLLLNEGALVDGRVVWYGRRVRGCRVFLVAAVLLLAMSIVAPLGAAPAAGDDGPGIIVFSVDPRAKDAQAMVDAVRAHLTGLPVRLVVESTGNGAAPPSAVDGANGSRHILGTLTIDPVTPVEWVVSFHEPAVDTTIVRRIRLKPHAKGVALEEAAIVVRSMVEAILDGGHVGIAKERAEPAPPPAASVPRAKRWGFAGTAGYTGSTFASGLGWQSGAIVGLRWQWGEFYSGATFSGFPPVITETSPASIVLVRYPGALVFGYEGSSVIAPTVEVDLVVDFVSRRTSAPESGYVATPPEGRWSFGMGAQAGFSWSFLPRFRVLALGGADWMLNPASYKVGTDVIVRALPVRPKVSIGLGLDIW
jgi:hypothetical protein